MIRILKKLCVGIFALALTSCEEAPPVISSELYKENPTSLVETFCGNKCEKCDCDSESCLNRVQENLPILCGNQKENCYVLWTRYVKDCLALCSATKNKQRQFDDSF